MSPDEAVSIRPSFGEVGGIIVTSAEIADMVTRVDASIKALRDEIAAATTAYLAKYPPGKAPDIDGWDSKGYSAWLVTWYKWKVDYDDSGYFTQNSGSSYDTAKGYGIDNDAWRAKASNALLAKADSPIKIPINDNTAFTVAAPSFGIGFAAAAGLAIYLLTRNRGR